MFILFHIFHSDSISLRLHPVSLIEISKLCSRLIKPFVRKCRKVFMSVINMLVGRGLEWGLIQGLEWGWTLVGLFCDSPACQLAGLPTPVSEHHIYASFKIVMIYTSFIVSYLEIVTLRIRKKEEKGIHQTFLNKSFDKFVHQSLHQVLHQKCSLSYLFNYEFNSQLYIFIIGNTSLFLPDPCVPGVRSLSKWSLVETLLIWLSTGP